MNRIQFWLLLLLGAILLITAAFWVFERNPGASLTSTTVSAANSPVTITEVTRRHPNMLIINGKAPAGTALSLRLTGNKVGSATADVTGAFQLTTGPLPRDEDLFFDLDYGADKPVALTVIDRHPQLVALAGTASGAVPLQHPRTGSGILWIEPLQLLTHIVGQAPAGTTIYAYTGTLLIGKATTDAAASAPALFDLTFDGGKLPTGDSKLRFDLIDASGQLIGRSQIDTGNDKAWQTIKTPAGQDAYLWRDLALQKADPDKVYPGQFTLVAVPAAPGNQ